MTEFIERGAVLDIAMQYCPDDDGCSKADRDVRELLDEIETLPAADVQPVKRGHWIWKERHRNSLRVVKGIDRYGKEGDLQIHEEYKEKVNYCSECGKQGDEVSLNFCPNCGADMRGDTNDKT